MSANNPKCDNLASKLLRDKDGEYVCQTFPCGSQVVGREGIFLCEECRSKKWLEGSIRNHFDEIDYPEE